MIERLAENVPEFMGTASQTRCFLHVVNLIAKTLTSQFDSKKGKKGDLEEDHELAELQREADGFDEDGFDEPDEAIDGNQGDQVDDDEVLVDEMDTLTEAERLAIERSIRPIRLALVKVSRINGDIPLALTTSVSSAP